MQIQLPPMPPVRVTFVTQEPYWWAQWDLWLSLFTFALAAMTAWLALETRGLRKDSAKSIKAAEKSAEAAQISATVAQEMAQNRRAWITIRTHQRERHQQLRIPTHARVYLVNHGETPAFEIEISHTYIRHNPNDGQVTEETFAYEDPLPVTRLPLGPHNEIDVFDEFRYPTENDKALLEEQVTRLFWFGMVKYKNIAGEECCTKWCYEYEVVLQDFTPSYFHNDVT